MVNLVLGTATFGTGYGIANKGLKLGGDSVSDILATAQALGINDFDSAPAYGAAERMLGEYLDHERKPRVSSKISIESSKSVELMLASVKSTLQRTRVSKLANLYLHDPDALSNSGARETITGLRELIEMNLVDRVGVSVYSLDSLLKAKELFPQLSVFQVPENICDRRLLNSKELMDLHHEGNHMVVRSVFLQGLLLMPPNEIVLSLGEARRVILQLRALALSCNVSVLNLCLGYSRLIPWANGIVVGVTSAEQLREIIEADKALPEDWRSKIDSLPENILDSRRW